jgi:hypothetical protein
LLVKCQTVGLAVKRAISADRIFGLRQKQGGTAEKTRPCE